MPAAKYRVQPASEVHRPPRDDADVRGGRHGTPQSLMAAPLSHLRVVLRAGRPRSSSNSFSSRKPHEHVTSPHVTSVAAAAPRRAPPARSRVSVALRAATLLPPRPRGVSSTRRRCSTSSSSRVPIQQLQAAGVRVHFPRHSAAPRAHDSATSGEELGSAAASWLAPFGGPGEPSGGATEAAPYTGPLLTFPTQESPSGCGFCPESPQVSQSAFPSQPARNTSELRKLSWHGNVWKALSWGCHGDGCVGVGAGAAAPG